MTYQTEIHMSKGYSGKERAYNKGYIARITGLSDEYGFAREFLKGKPDSNDQYRKSQCNWNDVYELEPGLYELSEGGEKYLWIVSVKDGKAVKLTIAIERAQKIAQMMDDGVEFNEARKATKPQAA